MELASQCMVSCLEEFDATYTKLVCHAFSGTADQRKGAYICKCKYSFCESLQLS